MVGAALYLAEKVVGKRIDRANKIQYLVTGSWQDPLLKRKVAEPEKGSGELPDSHQSTNCTRTPSPGLRDSNDTSDG